jgi:hypothetical protein
MQGQPFSEAMDIAFIGEKDKFVVIYLDDITVFSQSDKEHCYHLRKGFLEMQKIWSLFKSQKVIVFHEGGKIIGAHSIS